MKLSELISLLEKMPQDQEVFIDLEDRWESIGEVFSANGEVFISKE